MSPTCELEYPETQFFSSPVSQGKVQLEHDGRSTPQTVFAWENDFRSTMVRSPQEISELIVSHLSGVAHVKAILMGRSGDVHHVWTMLDEWTAPARLAVYEVQRDLLAKLKGFELDFYVVAAENGEDPRELVSDIPLVWPRAA